jgi:EAL domain-containing protein (putative c-di-GMP-specific phosphodiesterase class I)
MRLAARARQEMAGELGRAIAEREFVLHFQPQVRLRDGMVVGAEALLRWQHPRLGLLAPGSFIEALARSPVATETGDWILRSACEQAARWHAKGLPIRIGVNLFAAQFSDGRLPSRVAEALAASRLPPEALELEITENIALASDGTILEALRAVRSSGVGIAFDDFGTGYASLSCLTSYPLTRLKIDRSFVHRLPKPSNVQDRVIVRSVIAMAHNLGLEVIAEGIETPEQLGYLAAKHCDEVQGFLYGKPMPAEEFETWARARRPDDVARRA